MTLLDVGFGLAGSVSHTWPIVYAAATGLGLVFYLCIVVTFLRWKYFVTRAVNVLGHDVGVTPGWSVGIWFIPIFNLFLPYLAIRSMLVCVGGERALKESKLNVWWALWVLDKVMIIPYSPTEVPSPALSVMTELVVIGAALSAIKVVKTLTSGILNADVEAAAVPQASSLEAGGSPES